MFNFWITLSTIPIIHLSKIIIFIEEICKSEIYFIFSYELWLCSS